MSIFTIETPPDTALVVIPSDDASVMAAFTSTSDFGTHLELILTRIKREVDEFQKVKRDPRSHDDREKIKSFVRKLAIAWEIWAWPDLDDFEGLIVHLLRCGYCITAIGVTRLDALIDETRASRVAMSRPQ